MVTPKMNGLQYDPGRYQHLMIFNVYQAHAQHLEYTCDTCNRLAFERRYFHSSIFIFFTQGHAVLCCAGGTSPEVQVTANFSVCQDSAQTRVLLRKKLQATHVLLMALLDTSCGKVTA